MRWSQTGAPAGYVCTITAGGDFHPALRTLCSADHPQSSKDATKCLLLGQVGRKFDTNDPWNNPLTQLVWSLKEYWSSRVVENSAKTIMRGGCQCGDVRYEVRGEPVDFYVCHCRECQKQSSSAFGISVLVKAADLSLLSGCPHVWTRPATIGGSVDCAFCPRCGSRVWHGNPERDDIVSIKGGSLDLPPNLADAKHIWLSSKLDGVIIPDHVETHSKEPSPQ